MTTRLATDRELPNLVFRDHAHWPGRRVVAEETPVALSYDGSTHAVMMATPADIEDFAIGFSLSEEIIGSPSDLESLEIVEVDSGIDVRMWLRQRTSERHRARQRRIAGPTGCGLCGVESIAEALRPAPVVESTFTVTPAKLSEAMAALQSLQSLNERTRAVHAAGLFTADGCLIVREDVGRHNALDKVIGAAVLAQIDAAKSIVLLTSRVSIELVQKAARFGAPILAAISAPTAFAIDVAQASGITIAAILRSDGFEIFTKPERITDEAPCNAA